MRTKLVWNTGQHTDTQIIATKGQKTFTTKPEPKPVTNPTGTPNSFQRVQAKLMGKVLKGEQK